MERLRVNMGKVAQWTTAWMGAGTCIAFLLPNHYSPWVSFHHEAAVGLAFVPLLVCASFWSLKTGPVPAMTWVGMALAIVPFVQLLLGQLYFAGDAWVSALYLLGFAFSVLAGACCTGQARETDGSHALAWLAPLWAAVILASIVSIGMAGHQWLMLEKLYVLVVEMPPDGRPFANLAQPNHLATLLLLGLAGLSFYWESGRLSAPTAFLAALFLVAGLVATQSRSVMLMLAWLIPFYGMLHRRCGLRTTWQALALLVAAYLGGAVAWPSINEGLLLASRADGTIDRLAQPGIRTVIWRALADGVMQAPWAGFGWGQISLAHSAIAMNYPGLQATYDSSHNLFLDIALWSGLPVAILTALALLWWFTRQLAECRDPLSWTTLFAIGAVFSHAMVEYPLSYAYFLLPTGLLMGALSAGQPVHRSHSWSRVHTWSRRSMPLLGAATAALFTVVMVEYLPYEDDWRLAQFQKARVGDLRPSPPPGTMVLTNLREALWLVKAHARPAMPFAEIQAVRKVAERYASPSFVYHYALVQALNDQRDGAQLALQKLCKAVSAAACAAAERDWLHLGDTAHPQLKHVRFPLP